MGKAIRSQRTGIAEIRRGGVLMYERLLGAQLSHRFLLPKPGAQERHGLPGHESSDF